MTTEEMFESLGVHDTSGLLFIWLLYNRTYALRVFDVYVVSARG